MKIGVIFCAFNAQPYLEDALRPWIEARQLRLAGHDFKIAAVSVPFENFPQGREDDTLDVLRGTLARNEIDRLIENETPMKETEARGGALHWLVKQEVDLLIQVDHDECYTTEQIERIMAFVAARPHLAYFEGSLKNFVFDKFTHLTEPFHPARIHRVQVGDLLANGFWDDNNVIYKTSDPGRARKDIELPGCTIPKAVSWTDHFCWLDDFRSKRKCEYQRKRWGRCSFDWDDARGGLIWRDGQPIPETAHD